MGGVAICHLFHLFIYISVETVPTIVHPLLCSPGWHGTLHGPRGSGGPAESGEHRVLQTDRHLLHGPGAVGDDVQM